MRTRRCTRKRTETRSARDAKCLACNCTELRVIGNARSESDENWQIKTMEARKHTKAHTYPHTHARARAHTHTHARKHTHTHEKHESTHTKAHENMHSEAHKSTIQEHTKAHESTRKHTHGSTRKHTKARMRPCHEHPSMLQIYGNTHLPLSSGTAPYIS